MFIYLYVLFFFFFFFFFSFYTTFPFYCSVLILKLNSDVIYVILRSVIYNSNFVLISPEYVI